MRRSSTSNDSVANTSPFDFADQNRRCVVDPAVLEQEIVCVAVLRHADEEADDLVGTVDRPQRGQRLAAAVGYERRVRFEQREQRAFVSRDERVLEPVREFLLFGARRMKAAPIFGHALSRARHELPHRRFPICRATMRCRRNRLRRCRAAEMPRVRRARDVPTAAERRPTDRRRVRVDAARRRSQAPRCATVPAATARRSLRGALCANATRRCTGAPWWC